jgi:LysR family transcriptional regulator, cell division regulator
MINQIDIKYFIEVAKTGHLTRASERLGITQPALSHCLRRIEDELKASLFVRSKKGMTLTRSGELLLQSSQNLIQSWDDIFKSIQSESAEAKGLIKFGSHSAVAQYTLPLFLGQFLKSYPKIHIELNHGLSRHMTEHVVSSQLDVAIAVNPVAHPDLIIKEIYKDEVSLWRSKKCLNRDVLITEPNLLQTQDIISKMNKRGFEFQRTIESPSLEVIANLVSHGVGCGILPERVLKAFDIHKYEKIKDSPVFSDRVCLVYKSEFRKTERGRVFIDAVINSLKGPA